MEESQFIDPPRRSRADNQIVATLHTRGVVGEGVQVAGLITSCPRFVVCVAEGDPLPAGSCIGDRLWGRRCSKGWTRKSNVACFKRLGHPCRRNFQRWKKSDVNFHRPFTSLFRRPTFYQVYFFPPPRCDSNRSQQRSSFHFFQRYKDI